MATETNGEARLDRSVATIRPERSSKDAFWMFPGQGAQAPGMGSRMLATYPEASRLVERAEELSGRSLRDVCLRGPMERLNESETLQPLWTALLLGSASRLTESGVNPSAVAGHSLGEWAALATAGVISVDDALRLASLRGALMARASKESVGGMLAVLDLERSEVERLIEGIGSEFTVVIANDNSPRQQVASGDPAALAILAERVADQGGKSKMLEVAGAWHCPTPGLLRASEEFKAAIDGTNFQRARVPIFLNAIGTAEVDPAVIRAAMSDQMVQSVRWRRLIEEAFAWGVDQFLEVGPSKVLRGLLRQILPDPSTYTVNIYDGSAPPKVESRVGGMAP